MSDITLCKWEKTDIKKDFKKISTMVDKPKYLCKNCARTANKKKWLCEPKALKKSSKKSKKST